MEGSAQKRSADSMLLNMPSELQGQPQIVDMTNSIMNSDDDDDDEMEGSSQKYGKKTKGRVKIKMQFIDNKLRRYTTFSKRKTGIMKKAYELSTLTGTQVMLLVASETGHVYTFATRKLQPMITSDSGKALIQTCLNSPDGTTPGILTTGIETDRRMNPSGFEETELNYAVTDEEGNPAKSPLHGQEYDITGNHQDIPRPTSTTSSAASLFNINQLLPPTTNSDGSLRGKSTNIIHQVPALSTDLSSHLLNTSMQNSQAATTTETTSSVVQQIQQQQVQLQLLQQQHQNTQQQLAQQQQQQQQLLAASAQNLQPRSVVATNGQQQVILASKNPVLQGTGNPGEITSPTLQTTTSPLLAAGAPAGTVMYQTPQGQLVYATHPAAAMTASLPEGYVLNIPHTPGLTQFSPTTTQNPTQQQFITIPITLPNTQVNQVIQPLIGQQSTADMNKK